MHAPCYLALKHSNCWTVASRQSGSGVLMLLLTSPYLTLCSVHAPWVATWCLTLPSILLQY